MLLTSFGSTNTMTKAQVNFPSSSWNHVLKLLGLIVVADKKTVKEEVDTFLDSIGKLRAKIDPNICLTQHMARDWFMRNRSDLEEIIDSLAYDTALCEILAPIKAMPHKLEVISSMLKIAVSDGEYADVEKGLIQKTRLYWNIENKPQHTEIYSVAPKHLETVRPLKQC